VGSNRCNKDETPASPIAVDPLENDEITPVLPLSNFRLRISNWRDEPQHNVFDLEMGSVAHAGMEGRDKSLDEVNV